MRFFRMFKSKNAIVPSIDILIDLELDYEDALYEYEETLKCFYWHCEKIGARLDNPYVAKLKETYTRLKLTKKQIRCQQRKIGCA